MPQSRCPRSRTLTPGISASRRRRSAASVCDARCDVGETAAERVVHRGTETELCRDVAFPVLEAAGVRAHLVAVGRDPGHRLQIEERRLKPIEDGTPHIEKAGPARPAQIFSPVADNMSQPIAATSIGNWPTDWQASSR